MSNLIKTKHSFIALHCCAVSCVASLGIGPVMAGFNSSMLLAQATSGTTSSPVTSTESNGSSSTTTSTPSGTQSSGQTNSQSATQSDTGQTTQTKQSRWSQMEQKGKNLYSDEQKAQQVWQGVKGL